MSDFQLGIIVGAGTFALGYWVGGLVSRLSKRRKGE